MSFFGFIPLYRTPLVFSLIRNDKKLFAFMNYINLKVEYRESDRGLAINETVIGNLKDMGLTRGEYRHCLEKAKNLGVIEVVATYKTSNSKNNLTTIRGTHVRLLESTAWNRKNLESNHRTTIGNVKTTTIGNVDLKPLEPDICNREICENNHRVDKTNNHQERSTKNVPIIPNNLRETFLYESKEEQTNVLSVTNPNYYRDLNADQKLMMKSIHENAKASNRAISLDNIYYLFKKFDMDVILRNIDYVNSLPKENVRGYFEYLHNSIKNDFAKKVMLEKQGKEFVELFKKQYNLDYIVITKQYFRVNGTNDTYCYNKEKFLIENDLKHVMRKYGHGRGMQAGFDIGNYEQAGTGSPL